MKWSKEIFARNLRKYMKTVDKSQREMSEIVGVSTATYSDWMNAKKFPRIDKIEILANYFGCLKSDLIEEKLTEEKEKDNDLLADIIVRMRTDKDFMSAVVSIYKLDASKLKGVDEMLRAFTQ